ncbi:adenylate/guanylate cyclase domain-containing protein [Stappia sp.]|uniref:adenylate/guanylate cyclase domain-containing protein n=1 Tax=Stappia sp. TaxID=1870903 RepID=UPI0032D8FEAD
MTINASVLAADVMEWLYGEAVRIGDSLELIAALAERLNARGVRVDRITTGIAILHPNVRAESALWTSDGDREIRRYIQTAETDRAYENSPLKVVYTENRSVRIRLIGGAKVPDFGIVEDLVAGGYTDYIALPMPFSDGSIKGLTFATKAPSGFSGAEVSLFETIIRPLALICEMQTLKRTAHTLLETYVGQRAGAQVLDGTVHRGDGETISAVVGFFDLRGFTELSNELPGDKLIALLNSYFDAVTRAVEAHGGEVLKFIGDEVMAVFPFSCEVSAQQAARQALLAARDAVETIAEINRTCCEKNAELKVGIALHAGNVFFGNVGAETRLDFTVVGPVVNLASRIAGLTRDLQQDVLVSEAIADIMGCRAGLMGAFQVKGFEEPVSVFMPPLSAIGSDGNWCSEAASARALDAN